MQTHDIDQAPDWRKLIDELIAADLTQEGIAAEIKCSPAQVSDLRSGKRGERLNWGLGQRLIKLHEKRCVNS